MSRFQLSHRRPTTFNAGSLIPIDCYPVIPGDVIHGQFNILARMTTPIRPVMDDAFLDIGSYFIPYRVLWVNFTKMIGDQDTNAWNNPTEYFMPQITFASGWDTTNKVSNYLGVPRLPSTGIRELKLNSLAWRAYRMIYNNYYRDTALQDPVLVQTGDTGDTPQVDDLLLPVNRLIDYFSMARPKPQAGPQVSIIPNLPVFTGPAHANRGSSSETANTLSWSSVSNGDPYTGAINSAGSLGTRIVQQSVGSPAQTVYPDNLIANSDAATVNNLRIAVSVQAWEEQLSRSGSLYRDIIKQMFGVKLSDDRLQRPEYIDGDRIYINMAQVVQTSSTDTTSPQGNVAGVSVTRHQGQKYDYYCPEHGLIMTVACLRTKHMYQQGVDHYLLERSRYDLYWPQFAGIGDQPIKRAEIYASGIAADDQNIWGYVPAWEWLRRIPDRVTGAFNSTYSGGSLDSWHYADYYESAPTLSAKWIEESPVNIDRTLAVQSSLADQLMLDYYVHLLVDRNLPSRTMPDVLNHYY